MNHPNRSWRRQLADEAAALGADLLSAGIRVLGGPEKASRHLSLLTKRPVMANKLCRWRRGAECCPEWLQDALRVVVADVLLGDHGLAIARVMSPPERVR